MKQTMNIAALIVGWALTASIERAKADSPRSPAPDAGMRTAVEAQIDYLKEGSN